MVTKATLRVSDRFIKNAEYRKSNGASTTDCGWYNSMTAPRSKLSKIHSVFCVNSHKSSIIQLLQRGLRATQV